MKKVIYMSALLLVAVLATGTLLAVSSGPTALARARHATEDYRRMDLVVADGFAPLFECIDDDTEGAMGFHYVHPDRFDAALSVTEPEGLVFEPKTNGGRRLVAIEYIIPAEAWSGDEPPAFLGQTLKYKTTVGPHAVAPYYELHVWLWKENPSGVFADWNPSVACANRGHAHVDARDAASRPGSQEW